MSWIGSIFGADDLQTQGDALDAQLAAMNARDYAPGGRLYNTIAQQQGQAAADAAYQQTLANLDSGQTGDVDAQINSAFQEGLQDGLNNITGFVSGVFRYVGKALGAILLGIPAWAWLAGIGAVWVYLGMPGLKHLKKKLS